MEQVIANDQGVVANTLDQDGKPYLLYFPTATIQSQTSFSQWYRDVPGTNIAFARDIVLEEDPTRPGTYSYDNAYYYPIDAQGFGNYYDGHNYHFTTEVHTKFTYHANLNFEFGFTGDDDLWVFINGRLAIDLGGVHGSESLTVNLNTDAVKLGLVDGNDYTLDIFGAERHTVDSHFKIETTILTIRPVPPDPVDEGFDASICAVTYHGFCKGIPTAQCPRNPSFNAFGPVPFDFFNAISFDRWVVNTGDIEGRLAVQGTANIPGGYSIGYLIHSADATAEDTPSPYAFVVGRDASFQNGEVHPDGQNDKYNSVKEDIFVGGQFVAPAYLQQRRTGKCSFSGCLDHDFSIAKNYYSLLSSAFSSLPDNMHYTVVNGGVQFTCDAESSEYTVTISDTDFNQIRYYQTSLLPPCKAPVNGEGVQFVINVAGNADIAFGDDFIRFAKPEWILYNVLGSNRFIKSTKEVHGSILAPSNSLNQQDGTIIGNVIVGSTVVTHQINRLHCPRRPPPPVIPPSQPVCPFFESKCDGLVLPVGPKVSSFRDYSVISFDDFTSLGADVEGRVAVKDDVHITSYSIGLELRTGNGGLDNSVPYALLVGDDAYFSDGSVYPDGSDPQYKGETENIFVGNVFTAPDYLQQRRTGSCNGVRHCLDSKFDAARRCYQSQSDFFAAQTDNLDIESKYNGLKFHCWDGTATRYYASLTPAMFVDITYYVLDNCNVQAEWILNIRGDGDLTILGDEFPTPASATVYNFIGSGRTWIIPGNTISGTILAPGNDILQETGGLVIGKIIAGNVTQVHQVNIVRCPKPRTLLLTTVASGPAEVGSTDVPVFGDGGIKKGDTVNINSDLYVVEDMGDGVMGLETPLKKKSG